MVKIFLFFLFSSFATLGCSAQPNQTVTLKADKQESKDPYTWDFGGVKEGTVLEHKFILKNEAPKTLIIKNVNTSCGCTISKVEKKKLLPGETTDIFVKFNTKGHSGNVQQFIYVHTDELDNPVIRFIIKADIVK